MKKNLTLVSFFLVTILSNAQISGDNVVCAGYTYTYTVNIPGAVTFNWTFPGGWYGISGQGSSSVSATCNVNTGNICVEGFDINSISVGTECLTTQWGSGGAMGWDIYPSSFYFCAGQLRDVFFHIFPNGTGSTACPGGCGNGVQHANLIYGVYDSSIPDKQYVTAVDSSPHSMPPIVTTYHVYYVDTTLGSDFPDAIEISGGCGAAVINNTVSTNSVTPWPPVFIQSPDPACLGDTVLITQTDFSITNLVWQSNGELTFIGFPNSNQALVIVTGQNPQIYLEGYDQNYFCNTSGQYSLNMCFTPSAAFFATANQVCPGTCATFNNASINGTSYEWLFPGGNPSSSTLASPGSVCYNTPGSFDVTLIVSNTFGSDTAFIPACVTVYPFPAAQAIIQNGNTLSANAGFVSYQWYYNNAIIPGATNSNYIATSSGDYSIIALDQNGCESEAFITNVQVNAQSIIGDTVVCAGYIYNYTVSIPGAVSYTWTLPVGWYGLTGQGTSSISATCNVNTGPICVEGFDMNSISVGTECINTQWGGGGGQGWDVNPSQLGHCQGAGINGIFTLDPNGTGGGNCPPGCGTGALHPNLIYGLYDSSSPNQLFMGEIGQNTALPPVPGFYYVYYVDVTLGYDFPDAIIISGGCGTAVVNNVVQVSTFPPVPPQLLQTPSPACIGDTVLISQMNGMVSNSSWSVISGISILSNPAPEQALVVITSSPADIQYVGSDVAHGCFTSSNLVLDMSGCGPPSAAFATSSNPICPGTCITFTNLSTGASSYQWSFIGAVPATSTDVHPLICYNTPGTYDVTLIASSPSGSDTLVLANYIDVLPFPPAQSIVLFGDTLLALQGFVTYQWYHNGSLIPGATDYFYVASLNGDYHLICTDNNGCEVETGYLGFMNIGDAGQSNWIVYPNPVADYITLKHDGLQTHESISIYDLIGKKILPMRQEIQLQSGETIIDAATLLPGIYFLEIIVGEKPIRIRFIKD